MSHSKFNLFSARCLPFARRRQSQFITRFVWIGSQVVLGTLLGLAIVVGSAAAAPNEAINFDGTVATNDGPFAGYMLGWEFDVTAAISVVNLGWFDDGSGLSVSHPIGIFNTSGALLGSAEVAAGDPLVSSVAPQPGAGFRYHALDSPFELPVGTYRIGGLNPAGSTDKNYDYVGSLSSAPGVSYVHSYYQPADSLVYPDTFGDREKGYFGPNFQFNNVDDPPGPDGYSADRFPAISINLASNVAPVGANAAGVGEIISSNWNDIPAAPQTNTPLKDNSGATVAGLTLSTHPASDTNSGASFDDPGDTAMMQGHIYLGAGASVDVHIDGTIPYATYDVFVYYNSGAVPNTQTLSLLAGDLSDLGLSANVSDVAGVDRRYVEATDPSINANYVKFEELNNLDLPNFVLRAQNAGTPDSNQYAYINGFQIVNTTGGGPIPTPTDRAWRDDISGDWHEVSNWLPLGVPNDDTQTATFGDVINQPRAVFLDTDVTVKKVVFLSTNRYAVTGTGIVNLDAGTSSDPSSFDVLLGDHEFQAKVRLHTDTEVTIAGGTSLTFNNTLDLGGNTLTKLEAGDLRIRNDLVTGGGMINVLQGTVSGNGTVGGDLNNDGGAISPGNPSAVPLSGVPEPSTFLMLAVGFLSVVVCWTRGRSRV